MASDESITSSGVTTGPQFEQALQVAEALLKRADRAQEKTDRILAAEVGTVAVAVAVAAIIVIFGFSSGILGRVLVLVIGSLAGLVAAGAMHVTVRARLISQSKRDVQAALDIVSLLREVLALIMGTEKWSETQLRLARARLSRFPIGKTRFLDD
jgi:hypothetical protein